MTVALNLKAEVEAELLAQAKANGMTLEEYLLSMLEGIALSVKQEDMPAHQRAATFEKWAAGHRPTPDLSHYAVSRESIYEGLDE